MTDKRRPQRTRPTRQPGWRPERGVFIVQEGDRQREVLAGVALLGPNGRRLPPRKPIVICDPARRPARWRGRPGLLAAVLGCFGARPRPQPRPQPGALQVAAWIVLCILVGYGAVAAAAACVGSF